MRLGVPELLIILVVFAIIVYVVVRRLTSARCPFCAERVRSEANVCSHCGKNLGHCPFCSKPIHSTATICQHCHREIKAGQI